MIAKNKPVIYFAASLFNLREKVFNCLLVNRLEERGYKLNFPQRNGFEFSRLREYAAKKIPADINLDAVVQYIIYLLDMGVFIPKSNVVLANLDEPLDPGVIVEVSYAKMIGKFVLGFRTDVRTPFGNNNLIGMHIFPSCQCDIFIDRHDDNCTDTKEVKKSMNRLTDIIIDTLAIDYRPRVTEKEFMPPHFTEIIKKAKILFESVGDIHSPVGLREIIERYFNNIEIFREFAPKINFY